MINRKGVGISPVKESTRMTTNFPFQTMHGEGTRIIEQKKSNDKRTYDSKKDFFPLVVEIQLRAYKRARRVAILETKCA